MAKRGFIQRRFKFAFPFFFGQHHWHRFGSLLNISVWNPVHLDRIGQISTYWYVPVRTGTTRYKAIWNLAKPDIGGFPDIGSPTDTISGYVSRYRGCLLTRYRDMSHVTRSYRVHWHISGTYPISGHHVTDIVNHIPDIGINIALASCSACNGHVISESCNYIHYMLDVRSL